MDYKPQKVRRVEIPKANGKTRPLGIPTIGDRLVQQCISQVLEPICEAKFYKHSYGFRPNRSTKDAIAYFVSKVNLGNCYFVVDVDIKGFFDNVNHSKLLKQLWSIGIRDKNLLCVISKMLKAEIENIGIPDKGVPQGGILSPLLSNVVLNELDWWIADQWETFETRHTYWEDKQQPNGARFRALRKSGLKEMYLVRYADDFKILCKSMNDANKIFIAIQQWLQSRLGLEVSPEKSKIVDIRETASEFLGLSFKGVERGIPKRKRKGRNRNKERKTIIHSHITAKSKEKVITSLKTDIKKIQKNPTLKNVNMYNSGVLGMQQYYNIATHINLDFNDIAFSINKVIRNRTKQYQSKVKRRIKGKKPSLDDIQLLQKGKKYKQQPKLELSATYLKFYKNNYKKIWIARTALFPLGDVQTKMHPVFTQSVNNYTSGGRALIHDNRAYLDMGTLHYLMNNPLQNASIEFNDNRLSLYSRQYGICDISGDTLIIGEMEVHHKIPKHVGGTDAYRNLIYVTYDVHKLIHATEPETISYYRDRLKLKATQLKKLNQLREQVGNSKINKSV